MRLIVEKTCGDNKENVVYETYKRSISIKSKQIALSQKNTLVWTNIFKGMLLKSGNDDLLYVKAR